MPFIGIMAVKKMIYVLRQRWKYLLLSLFFWGANLMIFIEIFKHFSDKLSFLRFFDELALKVEEQIRNFHVLNNVKSLVNCDSFRIFASENAFRMNHN